MLFRVNLPTCSQIVGGVGLLRGPEHLPGLTQVSKDRPASPRVRVPEHGMQLVNHDLLRSFWFKSVERGELFQRRLVEGDSLSESGAENFGESTRSDEVSNDHDVLAYFRQRKVILQCSNVRNQGKNIKNAPSHFSLLLNASRTHPPV